VTPDSFAEPAHQETDAHIGASGFQLGPQVNPPLRRSDLFLTSAGFFLLRPPYQFVRNNPIPRLEAEALRRAVTIIRKLVCYIV
jgi:hypothetical protein